jgi:hypothetical protein
MKTIIQLFKSNQKIRRFSVKFLKCIRTISASEGKTLMKENNNFNLKQHQEIEKNKQNLLKKKKKVKIFI